MAFYDEQLQKLQQQIARKKRLETRLKELDTQRAELSRKVRELETIKVKEQQDVERLEGGSLASFFYNVIGKKDEQLSKEQQEAYAAAVKYDVAASELAAVDDDIRRAKAEKASLHNCERSYQEIFSEKMKAIKNSGSVAGMKILELEEKQSYFTNQKREILEAISAGQNARYLTDSVLSDLDSAQNWGTWDMIGGGGIITHVAKHNHLDNAQRRIEELQVALRRFKTELADVTIHADIQVSIDGFIRFADYFFDNFFTDWMVQDKINQSKSQVQKTKSQIDSVISKLNSMKNQIDQEQRQLEAKIKQQVLETTVE